ncbi:orotidine-5'-phosphate decarboxylase [bacterium]
MSLERIIVALDVNTREQALEIVGKLGDRINFYKIGSVLFTHYGPSLIKEIKAMGKKVFLDLKYHDIPNTVSKAVIEAGKYNVDMLTLHTLGGFTMLKEAVLSAKEYCENPPILLGVTVLTSMKEGDLYDIGINRKVEKEVKKLAIMAKNAGIKGIVCSPREIKTVRKACKNDVIIITPGIRPKSADKGDQKRVATPKEALDLGADYLVIGRPVIKAENVELVLDEIEEEMRIEGNKDGRY